jgi:hypothetical protein
MNKPSHGVDNLCIPSLELDTNHKEVFLDVLVIILTQDIKVLSGSYARVKAPLLCAVDFESSRFIDSVFIKVINFG